MPQLDFNITFNSFFYLILFFIIFYIFFNFCFFKLITKKKNLEIFFLEFLINYRKVSNEQKNNLKKKNKLFFKTITKLI